jgi:hypothetical protein
MGLNDAGTGGLALAAGEGVAFAFSDVFFVAVFSS